MKFNTDYAFPHPVLGINDDISGNASAIVENDETSDPDNYILTIKYQLDNPDLIQFLSEGKVEFLCELSCTSTLYRRTFTSPELTQTINVPKNFVRDEVEILLLMVAKQVISQYKNDKMHPELSGYIFDIEKGDVLAYLGESRFIAGVAYQKLMAVSSFMEIIKGQHEEGAFNIILESAKIEIQVSKSDYEKYREPAINQSKDLTSTFHTAIVLPALIHALYQLLESSDDISDTAWAKIIQWRIDNDKNLQGVKLNKDNVLMIAQALLGTPLERLLTDLYNKSLSNSDD